ncbi:hypothetical protein K470DRAFT_281607 [Piedraia hortae CBS 480.64]|uniref:P-loop containing nucleoside triphosphate hydrolase protein n=1 Tax=Piedraia hortae CBS 480.64 TaxID=1314780 RepID=A0A6A7C1H8_9PEZI|nr:hypothetical protein K470DRAFT_281607 [Piedraia hortae CBS 480.64]
MSSRPILAATHPRACSTAFERVFMTRHQTLNTLHEPFGEPFYFGPERMSSRFEDDEATRGKGGFSGLTYKMIFEEIEKAASEGKRVFIKDMALYLVPPEGQKPHIAPTLANAKLPTNKPPFPYETPAEPGNPTIIPKELLEKFHFTFLIRHPKFSIPSYYRCCIPPLLERTGFSPFMPSEAGYKELRVLFDWCKDNGLIGPNACGQDGQDGQDGQKGTEICVIDADDLLDDPEGILTRYCRSVGIEFEPDMLNWNQADYHEFAKKVFDKWDGWHDDALGSNDLKPRKHKKVPKSDEEMYAEWTEKFGKEGADVVKKTVEANVADYDYLRRYAIRI